MSLGLDTNALILAKSFWRKEHNLPDQTIVQQLIHLVLVIEIYK